MIDTSAVNFAIGKMSEVWQKAAPQIENVSTEYVNYVVVKACIIPVLLIPLIIGMVFLSKYFAGKIEEWEDWAIAGTVLSGVFALMCAICFLWGIYDMILALYCPEMFTIHQLIGGK